MIFFFFFFAVEQDLREYTLYDFSLLKLIDTCPNIQSSISLMIFCLVVLPINENRILRSQTVTVLFFPSVLSGFALFVWGCFYLCMFIIAISS